MSPVVDGCSVVGPLDPVLVESVAAEGSPLVVSLLPTCVVSVDVVVGSPDEALPSPVCLVPAVELVVLVDPDSARKPSV